MLAAKSAPSLRRVAIPLSTMTSLFLISRVSSLTDAMSLRIARDCSRTRLSILSITLFSFKFSRVYPSKGSNGSWRGGQRQKPMGANLVFVALQPVGCAEARSASLAIDALPSSAHPHWLISAFNVGAADSGINLRSDLNLAIWQAFRRENIQIPYPRREIRMVG
jgi:hypothetical protein